MRIHSPAHRIVLGLLAVLHLSAPTVAAVAHARLSQASAVDGERVHVENLGRRHAVPTHPESCVLCQLLGRGKLAEVELMARAESAVRPAPPPRGAPDAHSRTATARPSSRAPPAHS